MSSNAFPRSRPRVRHQRAPRTHTCDHPRFIQLVNELARISEAKKKQELEGGAQTINYCGDGHHNSEAESNLPDKLDCSSTNCGSHAHNAGTIQPIGGYPSCTVALTGGPNNYCGTNGAQTSNGYRSLDSCQSTSALHDNYYQQHQNNHHPHHHHHHSNSQHHNNHHHHQVLLQFSSISGSHQDDRCLSKNTPTNFGYPKQNFVEQGSSDFTNDNSDLNRQDENRSKRKRSSNDAANSRKSSSSSCGGSCNTSKRHKSSPDNIRPLSPSFTKCPICLLDSMDRDPSFTNTCFHLFCYVCIENWTKNKATCPLCRTKFTKIIYNIKSATNYDEKIASPIRRDDDDGYIADRLMLEHLSNLNSNSSASGRNANNDEVQFLFENLRSPEVLMPQYFINQIDPRQSESLHSFNTVTTSTNFNSNMPNSPFTTTSYPMPSNYVALFPPSSNPRLAPQSSAAIPSAYTSNPANLTSLNNDPNARRISRSGRYVFSRTYEPQVASENPNRVNRGPATSSNQTSVTLERNHPHQHPHQHQHQSHHPHHHSQRSTLDMSSRQNPRIEQSHAHIHLPYQHLPRHYNPPNAYPRRLYNNPQAEHHPILDTLYRRPLPDM